MTNFLISLILGLWLLVVVAFYALIVGAAVCRILAGLRQSFGTLARVRDLRFRIPPARRHLKVQAHPLEAAAAAGILALPAACFVWTASSLIRNCWLILLVVVASAWILARHLKE